MASAWLGLGSNVNAEANIRGGIGELEATFPRVALSLIYASKAVGFSGDDFINLVARVETGMPPLELREDLYLASAAGILRMLQRLPASHSTVLVIGHNPGFTDFANFLVPRLTNNLPTAGVVSVEIDQDDWGLYERPATRLLVHDWPKKIS